MNSKVAGHMTEVLLVDKRTRANKIVKTIIHPEGTVSQRGPVADINGVLWDVKGYGSSTTLPKVELPSDVFRTVRVSSQELAKTAARAARFAAGVPRSYRVATFKSRKGAAEEWRTLDRVLTQWTNGLERKLSTSDVPVKVNIKSEGIQNSRLHPRWDIGISFFYDEVEPTTIGMTVSGDAQQPDEVLLEYGRYDHTTGHTYNDRSKELYDWTPRDVIAVLKRWL